MEKKKNTIKIYIGTAEVICKVFKILKEKNKIKRLKGWKYLVSWLSMDEM